MIPLSKLIFRFTLVKYLNSHHIIAINQDQYRIFSATKKIMMEAPGTIKKS